MKIKYRPRARKQIKKLPSKIQKKVISRIETISGQPYLYKKLSGELLQFRSARVWPYRIIYQIIRSHILIYSVSRRQSAYN